MGAGSTYTPIATQTLGSSAATVTFSSISGSYTDLVLIGTPINGATYYLQANGDSSSGLYSATYLSGARSAATSGRQSSQNRALIGSPVDGAGTTTSPSTLIVSLNNYSNSTTYKTFLSRNNGIGTTSETVAVVSLWRNTNAITSITVLTDGGTFASGSTFTLYGIVAA